MSLPNIQLTAIFPTAVTWEIIDLSCSSLVVFGLLVLLLSRFIAFNHISILQHVHNACMSLEPIGLFDVRICR